MRQLWRLSGAAVIFALFTLAPRLVLGQTAEMEAPKVVLTDIPFDVKVVVAEPFDEDALLTLEADGIETTRLVGNGVAVFEGVVVSGSEAKIQVLAGGQVLASASPVILPGWASVLPAFLAILIALVFRQVIPAIFGGIWLGAWFANGFTLQGAYFGLLDTVQVYVLQALSDSGNVSVLTFSLMIGGMIGIISASGGTIGIVNRIVGFANSPKRGQLTAAFLGVAIFFDDYANTLIVGNTMRPVTDRLRISREKLSYIVDSTAAPVAALALVTTWIGYEVGLIDAAVRTIDGYNESAYSVFLNSVGYSFYPILAVFFVFIVAAFQRDFGPMYRAEVRAMEEGLVVRPGAKIGQSDAETEAIQAKEGKPRRAVNAVVPVMVLVLGTLLGIYITGVQATPPGAGIRDIIGNGDSYKALVWASLLGVFVAGFLAVIQRLLTVGEVVESWYAGLKSMMFAIIILVLAWSLSGVNTALNTGTYLTHSLGHQISPHFLPSIVFFIAAATAFATGSSWGVMGIVMPLIVPLAWAVMDANGMTSAGDMHIMYSSISAVLAGAVWGDHCSPISDTTILSSMASSCDHVDHVRTQLPYAITVGFIAMLLGTLPVGYGLPWWAGMLMGAVALVAILLVFGKRIYDYVPPAEESSG